MSFMMDNKTVSHEDGHPSLEGHKLISQSHKEGHETIMDQIHDYNEEIQQLFLNFLVTDPELFVRVNGIIEPYMFNKKFQATVKFLKDHATDYSSIPTIDQISATTNVDLERIDGVNDNHCGLVLSIVLKDFVDTKH